MIPTSRDVKVQTHLSCSSFVLARAGPTSQSSPIFPSCNSQGFALKASPPAAQPTPLRPATACCIARMTMMWFGNGPWRQGKSFAALTIEVAMQWSMGRKSTCSRGWLGSSETIWIAQTLVLNYVSWIKSPPFVVSIVFPFLILQLETLWQDGHCRFIPSYRPLGIDRWQMCLQGVVFGFRCCGEVPKFAFLTVCSHPKRAPNTLDYWLMNEYPSFGP